MRKMLVAAIILALIVTAWSIEGRLINKACDGMLDSIEKLRRADEDDLEKIISKVDAKWENEEKILDVLTPHEDTDEINVDWARFTSCVRAKNYPTALLVLDEMQQHFEEIRKKTKVDIQNIF